MNKEIIKEQIIRSLEDILEQTNAIFENDGKIPLIELDIIKANVRKLYEQYANLNNHTIILSDPISVPTSKTNNSKPAEKHIEKAVEKVEEEPVTPELVIKKEIPTVKIEEISKTKDIKESSEAVEDKTVAKRSFLKFEMINESEDVVVVPETVAEIPVVVEPIAEKVIEKEPVIEPTNTELIEEEEPDVEEQSPLLEEPKIEDPIIEEETTEIATNTVEEAIEEAKPIEEEPENTKPTKDSSETLALFPDLFGENPVEEKTEIIKRKRPKSPLDLFSDNTPSIADKFKDEKTTVNDKISEKKEDNSIMAKMQNQAITDIKKAIGINEKFLFINELFDGNMADYNQAVDHINANCNTKEEAEAYIVFLKKNYNWDDSRMSVSLFSNLIERRFPNN
ncbi:MAG: hypothetical protein WCK02_01715 [Bacteroidota bacterium]